jgi:CHAT domain-containing protein
MIAVAVALLGAVSEAAVEKPADPAALMQSGLAAFARGAFDEAAGAWAEAAQRWEKEGAQGPRARALSHLAQALQGLGQYREALAALEAAEAAARGSGDQRQVAAILGGLGNACLMTGLFDKASTYLAEALRLARELDDQASTAAVLNTLGTVNATLRRHPEALAAYQDSAKAAAAAGRPAMQARALLNAARLLSLDGRAAEARPLVDQAVLLLGAQPRNHDTAFALVSAGVLYGDFARAAQPVAAGPLLAAAGALTDALRIAEAIGHPRLVSYAVGHLGALYEAEGREAEALQLSRRAVFAAQQANAPESLYRWQWQVGRLLARQGALDPAIDSYRRAVETLQAIRFELTVASAPGGTSFRDSVGPVYLELVDLLLRRSGSGQAARVTADLTSARDNVELLKAAELRDYFRDDCVDAVRRKDVVIEQVVSERSKAAVIYPILLPDRLELLVTMPQGLRRVTVPVTRDRITEEVRRFRRFVEKRQTREYRPHAEQLYDWLIRPLEAELAAGGIDTLVFVPDGPLRTIPMNALHDGSRFLIAKYAVATTPGVNLTDPRPLNRVGMRLLALGLTDAVQGFSPLEHVAGELKALQAIYGSVPVMNQDFRVDALERQLQREPVTMLHIASHGQFSGDVESTFLLTYDGKLTMSRLDQFVGMFRFRDEPLELISLSACETAAGDDRAALGLAGVAVKAGARSALASLWNINDQAAAELVAEFYRQLHAPGVSRAVALQRAQLKILEDPRYEHPALWSAFLMINNWL